MVYTPQAPTPLSNGPTIIEAQVESIADIIAKMEAENAKTIEAQRAAEEEWAQTLHSMSKYTLIPFTDSWWNGANVGRILPSLRESPLTFIRFRVRKHKM